MENTENSKYTKLAKNYLATKERTDYYEITALNDDNLEQLRFLQEFNNDDLLALRNLREKYGMEEFTKHLGEVFADPDEIHDLTCGCEILDINLEKPYHQYRFARHELSQGSLHRCEVLVELTDEAYIRLLSYCINDKGMNVNKLRYADHALHSTVIREIDSSMCDDGFYMGCSPYLITMDEIQEDADRIRAENPDLCQNGCMGYLFV